VMARRRSMTRYRWLGVTYRPACIYKGKDMCDREWESPSS
jgi:hypothetical protein